MDVEKLIEQYRKAADKWEKRHPVTDTFDLRVQDALRDAATALSTLQAENEKLRADVIRFNDLLASYQNVLVPELRAELEQVKNERDAAGECIETVYSAILIKCKSAAVRTIEKWRGQRRRADNGAADCF